VFLIGKSRIAHLLLSPYYRTFHNTELTANGQNKAFAHLQTNLHHCSVTALKFKIDTKEITKNNFVEAPIKL